MVDMISPKLYANESLIVLVVCAISLALLQFRVLFRRLPLPPGPTPKLLSGNVHQLPKSQSWKGLSEWSKSYRSPVIYYRVFFKKYIVLNTTKATADLLEARSSIYSDRPTSWMVSELIGRKMSVFQTSSQHPRFKPYRRLLTTSLNPRAVQNYKQLIDQETRVLLKGFATSPDDFIKHIRRNAGAVILKVAYGWTVKDKDDYFVNLMEEAFDLSTQINKPGRWLVDAFPIPGFKRQALEYRKQMGRVDRIPHEWSKKQIESGEFVDSFTSQHLRPEGGHVPNEEDEDIIKWCSAALYAGGADTTAAAMTTFVLLMALHPDIQARAQAEIDEVVGKDRLPNFGDEKALPYVSALIKEVLRYAPVAPLGLSHRVIQEDQYMGYRIPKGSYVVANIWGMTHDPELYPDPMVFNPDRFVATSNNTSQMDPRKIVFGFGRRVCPGAHLAETTIFLNIVNILAMFNILKPLDKHGSQVEPRVQYTSAITSHPEPFKCRIVCRSSSLLSTAIDA